MTRVSSRILTITFLIALLAIPGIEAQESHLGLKGGWNNTTVSDIPDEWGDFEFDRKNGFHIGAFIELGLSDNFTLVGEALFSGKGAIIQSVDSLQVENESRVRLDYLTFPVLAQVNLGPLFVHAGPEFGFRLNTDVDHDMDRGIFSDDFWDQTFDLSGVVGAGVNIGNMYVAARYGLSFNKLIEVTESDIDGNVSREGTYGQNSFWQLSIGLRLL